MMDTGPEETPSRCALVSFVLVCRTQGPIIPEKPSRIVYYTYYIILGILPSSIIRHLGGKYVFTVFGARLKTLYMHCIWTLDAPL